VSAQTSIAGSLSPPALAFFEMLVHSSGSEDRWSPELYGIFGLPRNTTPPPIRELLETAVVPDDRIRVAQAQAEAIRDEAGADVAFRIRRPDGSIRFVQMSLRRRTVPEGLALSGTLLDVTEWRAAADAAHDMHERILAVGRWSLLGEMASGLAHELNQPLAAIAAYAQAGSNLLAREPARVERARAVLTEITAQALRAGDVLERTRRLVRVQPQERRPTDCNEIVRDFMVLAEPLARVHGFTLSPSLAADMPPIDADVVQLQQLLMILFRNAIDAVENQPSGRRRITIITADDSGSVDLGVEDSGPGVSHEAAREMFRPFFTTKPGGTGLGLAVCRSIASQHGGQLMFANQPGGGARFWARLPIDIQSASRHY
jgi:two-component system, LuxR family, sensor kinase FixL